MSPNPSSTTQRRTVVPYVTIWSTEHDLPYQVIERRGFGIGYADEISADRDAHGVLWHRTFSRPHRGRPEWGNVHSLRQRRAMRRLLCQVCGGPADQTEDGVLWLLPNHQEDWTGWPEGMGNVEPPICVPCVGTSLRLCPKLRRGAAAIRVREFPTVGVRGALYERGPGGPVVVAETVVGFYDPAIHWVRATNLVRELRVCAIVPLKELTSQSDQ
jgi:hypothetical protein